jgi:hypothetical protein
LSLDEPLEPKAFVVLKYLCQPWNYLFHDGTECPLLPTSDVWNAAENLAIAACKRLARAKNRAAVLPEA